MGFGENLMIALTAFTAAGSFIFAVVMETKDIVRKENTARKPAAKTA